MALVVNSTELDPSQNSYVSLAEMASYLTERVVDSTIFDAWDNLDPSQQAAYVVNSSRALDASETWIGNQYSRDQRLKWPRTSAYVEGFLLDVITTPQAVKEATCEWAIWSMQNDGAISVGNNEQFERIWVGPIKLNFNTADGQPSTTYFPPIVAQILADYGELNNPTLPGGNSLKQVRLMRS
jgi:hypothetical protein